MKRILLAAICVFSVMQTAYAVPGYGNTKWGMTPEEVVLAEKGIAHIQANPDVFTKGKGYVKIDRVDIGNDDYKVDFIFDSHKRLVMVNVASPIKDPEFINQERFKTLESLLTQKYGTPKYVDGDINVIWNSSPTTLKLTHLYIAGESYMVAVSYYPSSDVKADTSSL